MKKTKIKDRIRLVNGDVMTLGEALDAGRVVLRASSHYHRTREDSAGRPIKVETYTAWDGDEGWEVGETLFRSRMGTGVNIGRKAE